MSLSLSECFMLYKIVWTIFYKDRISVYMNPAVFLCSAFGVMADDSKWAQLVSTTDIESDHIQIVKNKLTIGRNRGLELFCFSIYLRKLEDICLTWFYDVILIIINSIDSSGLVML